MTPSVRLVHNRKVLDDAQRKNVTDPLNLSPRALALRMMTMTPGVPNGDGYPPILTTAQAAELLQVHVEYLRRMVREERIPAHRFPGGREIRFIRDDLI